MMKLYYSPNSCSLASHIALEEAGADYEAVRLDFTKEDQKAADYLAINPKARVPSLITNQGVLSETPALLLFIAQSYPDAALAPLNDPFALAQAQAFNSYLCSSVHVAHAHLRRGHRWADDPVAIEAMRAKVPQSVGECFDLINNTMIKGPWVLGDHYSICDPYLFTLTGWLPGDGIDRADLPNVDAHYQRMSARAAVQKIVAIHAGT
ncbi:MAG: glutathione S-transferase [Rhodospirillaceae bacterium]|jgi:glutathione S-transferase|nr:glutathione S-transferase [Rhodospirillaceae bacterium]MBT4042017.1 glutathione S-transferase [Rhodospirillaceae bacterium]MBT4690331.1 glutathione S-transferase [Rhodospirillaceae bacterium]MBT5079309.1 glutathione S-transferase [Rhodospirillaceae bacterium]MBT5525785.1 glutathione S-transferase [Rhodospirillaceae bacterium]